MVRSRGSDVGGSARRFRVTVVLLIVVGSMILGMLITGLHHRQGRGYEQLEHALAIRDSVQLIDGLGWRAIAGDKTGQADTSFEDAVASLDDLLGELDGSTKSERVRLAAEEYAGAVGSLMAALAEGDDQLAEQIAEERVDPGLVVVLDRANSLIDDQRASADRTEATVRLLTWTVLAVMTAGFTVVLNAALSSRERWQTTTMRAEADERLRAYVEGSQDVITLVSGDDDLAVLSPTLGIFERHRQHDAIEQVRELLPQSAYEQWLSVDRLIDNDGSRRQIEITLAATDGGYLHIEGHGSPLAADPAQRVWVWRDITARKELEEELSHQAFHDSLTGVANRSLLLDRVEHALSISNRSGRPVTVMFCDLDDFKTVNDSLGHGQGDKLLQITSDRISTCVRESDTVARLGGDEFAVLFEDATAEQAVALAERIISVVSYEIELDGRTVFPSISVGIATALPGATCEELLRNADLAMYAAKRAGKGRAQVYENRMHETVTDVLQLQTDLKTALRSGQLTLNYQPTVSLTDGSVEGVEALLRWNHPTRGTVPPDEFIHIAEVTGMIISIGRWVIEQACLAAVELQAEQSEPLLMAVNLSPQQLRDPNITAIVRRALEQSGLPPDQLVLEVTEGSLLDDDIAIERLNELSATGVLIAIDDFGTGYTSISYLQTLPISILKIDRSFISGDALAPNERQAFLNAIIGLATSLNLHSIAEGVEDDSQLDELRQLGCMTGQGFLWSRPASLEQTQTTIDELGVGERSTVGGRG